MYVVESDNSHGSASVSCYTARRKPFTKFIMFICM